MFLKLAMQRLPSFSWSWNYARDILVNWWCFLGCGTSFGIASVLWLYILRHFPFSQAHPLTALSYIFGMMAAILVFGEQVPWLRWVGVGLIVVGCFFIMK